MEHAAVPGMAEALEDWVHLYAGEIVKLCYLDLADADLSQDAMQDTFLKAWKYLQKHPGFHPANEKAWLIRIAFNTCKDYHRSQWFKKVDMRRSLEELPIAAPEDDRATVIELNRLPKKQRQVMILHGLQGMTMAETAELIGISRSYANRCYKQGKELLMAMLTGGEDDE